MTDPPEDSFTTDSSLPASIFIPHLFSLARAIWRSQSGTYRSATRLSTVPPFGLAASATSVVTFSANVPGYILAEAG